MFSRCLPILKSNSFMVFLKDCSKSGVLANKRCALSTAGKLYKKLSATEKQALARRAVRINAAANTGAVSKPVAPVMKNAVKPSAPVAKPAAISHKKKPSVSVAPSHSASQSMTKSSTKTAVKPAGNAHKAIKKASANINSKPMF